MSATKCLACGSKLQIVEYQARAADEATRVTTVCPKCPVKASKIKPHASTSDDPRGLSGSVRRSDAIVSDVLSKYSQRSRIVLEVPQYTGTDAESWEKHVVSPVAVSTYVRAYYNISGLVADECWSVLSSTRVGMGAALEHVQTYTVRHSNTVPRKILTGYAFQVLQHTELRSWMYRDITGKKQYVYVEMDRLCDIRDAVKTLLQLYMSGYAPASLYDYMSKYEISRLSDVSPRAWDMSKPRDSGYRYTSKPDGERMWLVLFGAYWYMCTKSGSRKVVKFSHDANCNKINTKPIVLDVEYCIEGGLNLLIDCLTYEDGTCVPISRDLEDMLRTFREIKTIHPSCPCEHRDYFDTPDEAESYSLAQRYSTDGIVGIRDGSTETVKIKKVKDVELLLGNSNELLTQEGQTVGFADFDMQAEEGTIMDIRFTAENNTTNLKVLDAFPRTDKTSANKSEAVMNILSSCVNVVSKDDNERRQALMWCNKIREILIKRALSCNATKHIILDVGTGTGQSLDSAASTDDVSYIYVEPDKQRAQRIKSRVGDIKLTEDPMEIVYSLRSLKTRSRKGIIINAPLSSVTQNQKLCDVLAPELRCIVATFSAQYVLPELHQLRGDYECAVAACSHVYDDAKDQVLVNSLGVRMVIVDDTTATYQWGNDPQFNEPVTYTEDYFGLGTVVKGKDLLAMPTSSYSPNASDICKNVIVVVP